MTAENDYTCVLNDELSSIAERRGKVNVPMSELRRAV